MKRISIFSVFGGVVGLCLILGQSLVNAQNYKPDAAIAPLATLGDISKVRKDIIFNRLQSKLSQYYRVISQQQFDEAQQLAFESLEADECTEEKCIRKIQEILQVERLFVLQLLKDEDTTQIAMTLLTLEEKVVVDDLCHKCGLQELYAKVEKLVQKIVEKDLGKKKLNVKPDLEKVPEKTEVQALPKQNKKDSLHPVVSIGLNEGEVRLQDLVLNSKNTRSIQFKWTLPVISLGVQWKSNLIEINQSDGEMDISPFSYSLNGETKYVGSYGNAEFTGIYYSPDHRAGWFYGFGAVQWRFTLMSNEGDPLTHLTFHSGLIDGGYMWESEKNKWFGTLRIRMIPNKDNEDNMLLIPTAMIKLGYHL